MFDITPPKREKYTANSLFSYNRGGWQKCPVCEGKGKVDNNMVSTDDDVFKTCPVCNGERIISEVTGKPPKD